MFVIFGEHLYNIFNKFERLFSSFINSVNEPLYLLKKCCNMELQSGLVSLKSKLGDIEYKFSDLMTKYLLSRV